MTAAPMVPRGTKVFVEVGGNVHLAGVLHVAASRNRQRGVFQYDPGWLENAHRFPLEPALALNEGQYVPREDRAFFGAIADSAPDRWGRALMMRDERRRAKVEGRAPRALTELDFLLGVADETRQGALRFTALTGGPFLADSRPIVPPLVELRRLMGAAGRIDDESETEEDLALLLAPGSSLGGARPKASVRDANGELAIAKFARSSDEWPVIPWEMVALTLAQRAGIRTPTARLTRIEGQPVLLLDRFDRNGVQRIPYLSFMSLLGARDNDREPHSYPDMADALRAEGARPDHDRAELWRRLIFNILISNTDDHLRNHGVLYSGGDGWILAPAFDLNPMPADVRPRVLTTALVRSSDGGGGVPVAFQEIGAFGLTLEEARASAHEVQRAVGTWREVAATNGLSNRDCERMTETFEPTDPAEIQIP